MFMLMLQRYKLSIRCTKNTNKTLIILSFLTQNRSDDSKKESEPCDSPSFRYNYFFFDRSALPLATEGTQELSIGVALVLVHVVAVAAGLGEQLACDFTRLIVLDGDGLHGGSVTQGECLTVERALSRRRTAVGGVVDLSAVRTADAH